MIQRIQSVYLFLVFLAAVGLIFFPIAGFTAGDQVFSMHIMGFENAEQLDFNLPNVMVIGILTALLGTLSLFTIFQFRNRQLQMKLNMVNLLINFGLLGSIFYFTEYVIKNDQITQYDYSYGAYFPVASVLFLILANRNIRADEKLIRNSERLR
jgi:peptidoglycan/LPS O-acetylase OafA/YrhL